MGCNKGTIHNNESTTIKHSLHTREDYSAKTGNDSEASKAEAEQR